MFDRERQDDMGDVGGGKWRKKWKVGGFAQIGRNEQEKTANEAGDKRKKGRRILRWNDRERKNTGKRRKKRELRTSRKTLGLVTWNFHHWGKKKL